MRSTQTCPKCAGKKFTVSTEFKLPDERSSNVTYPLPAITIQRSWASRSTSGKFETWICTGCGYTEFYACGFEDLDALARQHPDQLRIVDARPPEQGPYR